MDYQQNPQFGIYHFEESYVLGVEARQDEVLFSMDLVLDAHHPAYTPPGPDEQYCFRRGTLRFRGVQSLDWSPSGAPPAVDASGEKDFGNIDLFDVGEGGAYSLEGSWGRMNLVAESGEVVLGER